MVIYFFEVNNLFEVFNFTQLPSETLKLEDSRVWGQHSLANNSARTVKCSSLWRCGFYLQLLLFFQLSLVPFFSWSPHI